MKLKKKIKLYLIVSEEPVFHPIFVEGILKEFSSDDFEIVGVTLAIGSTKKISFFRSLKEKLDMFGLYAFCILSVQSVIYKLFNLLGVKQITFFSVENVVKTNNLPCLRSENVNNDEHINYLKDLDIDIIISSNGHIFKETILSIPKMACINRHTALLPQYGGLWPIFWAMLKNEKVVGQTVHIMIKKIDGGNILAQESFPIENNTLYKIYDESFCNAAKLLKKAVVNLLSNKFIIPDDNNRSYFSQPNKKDGILFRKNFSFFKISELIKRSEGSYSLSTKVIKCPTSKNAYNG